MNVHISYKIEKTADLENLLQQQTDKLNRYLQVFRPELVHLKGSVAEDPPHEGFSVSLNLRLPSGQMAASEKSDTLVGSVKAAFTELGQQLKKHKELLRNEHNWPRRRGPGRAVVETVPFEDTVAAVKPEQVTQGDIYSYVNANLPRLRRFVEREIAHRESEGQIVSDQVLVDDIIGETVANALGEQHDKPERMRLEPWLYRLSLDALNRAISPDAEQDRIPLEPAHTLGQVRDSGEPIVQFGNSKQRLSYEAAVPDSGSPTPEDLAARNELIDLVQRALQDAGREPREAFILYTIEGFTIDEISDITSRPGEEVRASIRQAREHLQRALPIKDPLTDKLVEYAKTA
jgi:RNA polymerase sigma factor (sigma-70 family)